MAIGSLYNANNVVVGQAACLFAPANTALPDFLTLNLSDPFDPSPWVAFTLTPGSSTSFTLSFNGVTSTSITTSAATAASVQSALAALTTVGTGNVTVTGTGTGPYKVQFAEQLGGHALTATWTGTAGSVSGGLWTVTGATDQGWTFGANKSTNVINIEEQSTQVATTVTTQAVSISGALSEDITPTLALALNGVITSNAAVTLEPAYDEINPTDSVLYYSVALIAANAQGYPRIMYAPKWSQLSNATVAFRRASAKRMYPVEFQTACQPGQIRIINITAPHA